MSYIRSILFLALLSCTIDVGHGKPTGSPTSNIKGYVKYLLNLLGTENEYTRFLSFMKISPPEDLTMKALYQKYFSLESYIADLTEVYAKYYTVEEILHLISFYSSPLGRKTLQVNHELNRQMDDMMLTKISDYIFTSQEHGFDIPLP